MNTVAYPGSFVKTIHWQVEKEIVSDKEYEPTTDLEIKQSELGEQE